MISIASKVFGKLRILLFHKLLQGQQQKRQYDSR